MITALLAGSAIVALLGAVRLRPDHRLRDDAPPARRRRPETRLWSRVRSRGRRVVTTELAGWCDALARDIRSGASLSSALRSAEPPAGTVFVEARRRLDRGVPLRDAVSLPAATSDEHAVLVVLAACAEQGGAAAQPLDRVASTLRRRAADDAERAVHSAQARLSAVVMTVLPGAMLAVLLATSGSVRDVVLTPYGGLVAAVGSGLNLVGWGWMRRIITGGAR